MGTLDWKFHTKIELYVEMQTEILHEKQLNHIAEKFNSVNDHEASRDYLEHVPVRPKSVIDLE